jgi:predicted TIM-barrel fold metal-dependent hydrolase
MSNESRQQIVDAHIHWWNLEENCYPWLTDQLAASQESGLSGAAAIAKSYLPDHYLRDAEGYNVVAVVHIEALWDPADSIGETRWLERIADAGEDRGLLAGIVGFTNLASDRCEELLEAHAAHGRVRGIRHMLNRIEDNPALCWADEDFTVNDKWVRNFTLLKKYGLGFDLMCFSNMMHRMADLAHRHPETPIYLEHAGMPHEFDDAGNDRWRAGMQALAANDNVVCKISGFGNTMPDWNEERIRPYVLEAIDIFGVDRIMFASNFPTDKLFSSMDAIWQAFLSITSDFSQAERDRMFAANAVQHYRLKL